MNWDGNLRALLAPRPAESSFGFLYHNYNHSEGMVFPHAMIAAEHLETKKSRGRYSENKTKKRLTGHQLEMLEKSFQDEIKLDPDRKMKLSGELGLEPRQVAVWFQNRRARWKAKQLESLYNELRLEFEVTSKEKLKLEEEALKLKAILRDQAAAKMQPPAGVSGEETVGSSSLLPIQSSTSISALSGWMNRMH